MTNSPVLNQATVKHVHFVGIGGIGLSAIARVLLAEGYHISGSDVKPTALTDELRVLGMTIYEGHDASNVHGADLVVVSSAVPPDNVEVVAATQAGIAVVKRARLLGEMMEGRFGIAIAGTHGKTTTAALLSFVLCEAGLDPTFIVGGVLQDLGTNAQLGRGPHLVIEADEYDRTFLGLRPQLAVVTAIEMDHPDCYADADDIGRAFETFIRLLPDGATVVGCADQPRVLDTLERARRDRLIDVVAYGLMGTGRLPPSAAFRWWAQAVHSNEAGGSDFQAMRNGELLAECRLLLPGLHNVLNALAVLAVLDRLGVPMGQSVEALSRFRGVKRRFEIKGEAAGVTVVDDYAHHPAQIRATLAAARRRYLGRPLWVLFQPHTYSRTKALLDDFASSFQDADHVFVSEIYAARERDNLGTSGRELVWRANHADIRYVASLEEAAERLVKLLRPGDVLLTLGAGDGYTVGEAVLRRLEALSEGSSVAAGHVSPRGARGNNGY